MSEPKFERKEDELKVLLKISINNLKSYLQGNPVDPSYDPYDSIKLIKALIAGAKAEGSDVSDSENEFKELEKDIPIALIRRDIKLLKEYIETGQSNFGSGRDLILDTQANLETADMQGVDISDLEKEAVALHEEARRKYIEKGPTKEELTTQAEDFVRLHAGLKRGYGDILSELVEFSKGEQNEIREDMYFGWKDSDFKFYLAEIKRIEPQKDKLGGVI